MQTWQYVLWIPLGLLVFVLLSSVVHQILKDRRKENE